MISLNGLATVIPHLMLDKTYAERPGVEGAKHVMSPPLRDKRNQKVLWDGLAQGFVDTIGTDHCPFDVSQKEMGKDAFTAIPNGIPAIEDRVNLLYTYGVSRGNLDIHRFVDAASTRAAKLKTLEHRCDGTRYGSWNWGCSWNCGCHWRPDHLRRLLSFLGTCL